MPSCANRNLPVVRGDMPDTWIHGIGSMPIKTQWRMWHAAHCGLGIARYALGRMGVPTEPAGPVVAAAYENTLLFGEHTWGTGRRPLCRLQLWRGVEEETGYGSPTSGGCLSDKTYSTSVGTNGGSWGPGKQPCQASRLWLRPR